MPSPVQASVDALGEELGRSVALNDPQVRLLYASRHYGDEDTVRVRAALHRDAGADAIAHVLAQGLHRGTRAGRIPANPELDMLARVMAPIRWRGELLGSVVVIDADCTLDEAGIAAVEDFARDVADLMVAERHAADDEAVAVEGDVAAWLGTDVAAGDAGLGRLVGRGLVRPGHRAQVLAARVTATTSGAADGERVSLALRAAADLVRTRSRLQVLVAVRGTSADFVLLTPVAAPDGGTAAAEQVLAGVSTLLGTDRGVHVGIGDPVADPRLARQSARQAEVAVRTACATRSGQVRRWDALGPFQVLGRLGDADLDATVVPAPVAALLAADGQGKLVETLLAYLRHGGAGQATAAALHVHRTTLYYRLDRIREITGLDVDDGDARLLLHMGLLVQQLRPRP